MGEVATYIRLKPEAAPDGVTTHLAAAAQANTLALAEQFNLTLQPLTGIALGPALGREIPTPPLPLVGAVFIGLLALVIMATAGFNYVGLTVAQSLERAKKVGIRKAVGAERHPAVQALGFGTPQDAIGRLIAVSRFDAPRPIRGVVRDTRFLTLASPVLPLVLYADRSEAQYASVRVQDGQADAVMARLGEAWAALDSAHPLDAALYSAQVRDNEDHRVLRDATRVVGVLAAIALAIACLGVLSMAAYGARARTKEVGIRKALGASSTRLVWTLSKEFAGLAALAAVLAVPGAWALNSLGLHEFAHRVAFGPLVIIGSLGAVGGLVALAVGSQALRTAWADPVDALRCE